MTSSEDQPSLPGDGRGRGANAGYVPLPVIGNIREKGFSLNDSPQWNRFSVPEPRVTPFPVARHRSEGPHWRSLSSTDTIVGPAEVLDDTIGESVASVAEPLLRKKKKEIEFSKWKAGRNKKEVDSGTMPAENRSIPDKHGAEKGNTQQSGTQGEWKGDKSENEENDHIVPLEEEIFSDNHGVEKEKTYESDRQMENLKESQLRDLDGWHSMHLGDSSLMNRTESESQGMLTEDSDGHELLLESMTIEQIIAAQQELAERFRPDILDMLRRRGQMKKQNSQIHGNKVSLSMPYMESVEEKNVAKVQGWRETSMLDIDATAAQTDLLDVFDWTCLSWTERVEAISSYRFGLDGSFFSTGVSLTSSSAGSGRDKSVTFSATERDPLRTEGDPASQGYSIKEATTLVRSMVPAQRSFGLRILSHILEKALFSLQFNPCEGEIDVLNSPKPNVDWQAIWAYALGPEPELVLTLRLALDDTYANAIIICTRALEYLLSSTANEHYFHLCECVWPGDGYLFNAPIFQKPSFQESGLIGDCYWKYNVKPADMFPFSNRGDPEKEETDALVKDDALIASQDVAAGLIRMGVLPRIRYILEVDKLLAAEESLFSILIALARHSPHAADAVISCPRLMDTITQLFLQDDTGTWPCRAKAIKLLKVLSIAKRSNCIQIFDSGLFQAAQFRLLCDGLSSGPAKGTRKISLVTLVEALNFWKICIRYSLGISCFSDFYPALLYGISIPDMMLYREGVFRDNENCALTASSFQLLESLARTLPILHVESESEFQQGPDIDNMNTSSVEIDTWLWKFAIPVVETALGWLSDDFVEMCIESLKQAKGETTVLFRILSSVLHFLSTVCERILDNGKSNPAWLPTFVPKLGLLLVRSSLLKFSPNGSSGMCCSSLVKCFLSCKEKLVNEDLLEVTNCLHGLVRLIKVLDHLFVSVNMDAADSVSDFMPGAESGGIEEALAGGLAITAKIELMQLLRFIGDCLIKQSSMVSMLYSSRRGGPAPGIGVGWGCQGGGYWSSRLLTARVNCILVLELLELFPANAASHMVFDEHLYSDDTENFTSDIWRIMVGLSASVLAGPHQRVLVEKAWYKLIFENAAIKFFINKTEASIGKWLSKLETDSIDQILSYLRNLYLCLDEVKFVLCQYVQKVWFRRKTSSKKYSPVKSRSPKEERVLPTVYENDTSASCIRSTLATEWAKQKLPLPHFWFLTPLLCNLSSESLTRDNIGNGVSEDGSFNATDVVRHGLLFLFGLETMLDGSSCGGVGTSVAIKLHALSNVFLFSDDIFLEKPVRIMIGALQELYVEQHVSIFGKTLEEIDHSDESERDVRKGDTFSLDFETLIDQRYSMFIDNLMSQFASVSYGDLVFSRQIAIYLTRYVPDSLRLKVWTSLESEHMLEFLPPLERCCGPAEIYFYPFEKNQDLLKNYASAWARGALDRARIQNSVSFCIARFHVASYIFNGDAHAQKQLLRRTFAKNLLLGLAQRPRFQDSLLDLINYDANAVISKHSEQKNLRYVFLEEACKDDPKLLAQIQMTKFL